MVRLVREPIDNIWNVLSNVVIVKLELRIILEVASLVEVRDINEVPVGLPAATLVLYHISERSTLNEGIFVFAAGDSLTSKS